MLASRNVNKTCKSQQLIESGMSRASCNMNGLGDVINIDSSYHKPYPCIQPMNLKLLYHKRREILVDNFCIMKNKRVLQSMLQ